MRARQLSSRARVHDRLLHNAGEGLPLPFERASNSSPLACRGYNIGLRLVDEFLAKSGAGRCRDFKETVDVIAKACCSCVVTCPALPAAASSALRTAGSQSRLISPRRQQVALRMFLGINASVGNWNAAGTECSLTLDENPLVDFAELPEQYRRER